MSPRQLHLEFPSGPSHEDEVRALVSYLMGKNWVLARSIEEDLGWAPRRTRSIAHASRGQVIGGQKGYRLTLEAEAKEVERATSFLKSQARAMQDRSIAIERVWHSRREPSCET